MPLVKAGMALAAALLLAMLPVSMAAMCRYPAAVRQRAIAAAHYVLGALLGGAAVGCVVAGLFWGACIAAGRRDDGGKAFGATLLLFAPATALLLWLFAAYRFHRRTTIVSGTAAPPFLLVFPLLMCLGIAVWLILVPWIIGLLWLIVVTLRG